MFEGILQKKLYRLIKLGTQTQLHARVTRHSSSHSANEVWLQVVKVKHDQAKCNACEKFISCKSGCTSSHTFVFTL